MRLEGLLMYPPYFNPLYHLPGSDFVTLSSHLKTQQENKGLLTDSFDDNETLAVAFKVHALIMMHLDLDMKSISCRL